jgi:hypothetical protein
LLQEGCTAMCAKETNDGVHEQVTELKDFVVPSPDLRHR